MSAGYINRVEDYERFRNTKAYIKKKAGNVNSYFKNKTEEIQQLAELCGYNDFNKFIKHRKQWIELERRFLLSIYRR